MSNLTRLIVMLFLNACIIGAGVIGLCYHVQMYRLRERIDEEKRKLVALQQTEKIGPITVIHAKGNSRPRGYRLVPDVFTEADGTKESAYVRDDADPGDFSFDGLKPGESISFEIFPPPAELPEKPKEVL